MVFLRLLSADEARKAGLSPAEHAALLQRRSLVDATKLADLAALYWRDNAQLTRSMLQQARLTTPNTTCYQSAMDRVPAIRREQRASLSC